MEDVANYVNRIIVMNKGSVMYDDEPKKVFRHVKELEAVGLAAPSVTYIMHTLKEAGLAVETDATTLTEARDAILAACGCGKEKIGYVKRHYIRAVLSDRIGEVAPAGSKGSS